MPRTSGVQISPTALLLVVQSLWATWSDREAIPPLFYPTQFRTTIPRSFRRAPAEDRLTEDDRRVIEEFLSERQAARHLACNRVRKSRCDCKTRSLFVPGHSWTEFGRHLCGEGAEREG